MNKTRFTLAAIITIIGGISFFFFSFMGAMYLEEGNYIRSLIKPSIFTLLLISLSFLLSYFKKAKINYKRNAIKEIAIMSIYILLAIISMESFSHFFSIQKNKTIISKEITLDIDSARNMFSEYELKVGAKMIEFDYFLNTTKDNPINDPTTYNRYFIAPPPSLNLQMETLKNSYLHDLKPPEYDTLKKVAMEWLDEAQSIITSLRPLGLMNVINSFEQNTLDWRGKIAAYSTSKNTFVDDSDSTPFNYPLTFNNIKTQLTQSYPPDILTIIYLVITHLGILFVYFMTLRNGIHPGFFKALFSTKSNSDITTI